MSEYIIWSDGALFMEIKTYFMQDGVVSCNVEGQTTLDND